MKKIYIFLAALVLLTGCDDGDMTFKQFNFDNDSAPVQCPLNKSTIYRINGSEALVMNLSESLFINAESPRNANNEVVPTTVLVGNGTYSMFYRVYSSTPGSGTFCGSSGTPNILEQWSGNGRLSIISTARRDDADKVIGYSHQITIESATFSKGDQEVTIVNELLGTLQTSLDITFDFGEEDGVQTISTIPRICDNGTLYKINGDETLQLQIPSSYFTSTAPEQTFDLNTVNNNSNDNDNIVFYFVQYDAQVGTNTRAVCQPIITDPRPEQTWIGLTGTLVITYEQNLDGDFEHIIRFRDLVLRNNALSAETYRPVNNSTNGNNFWFGPHPTL